MEIMCRTLLFLSSLLLVFVASCGGGSTSSENKEANVTDQCQKVVAINSDSGVFDNGCDFAVNIDYVLPNGAINRGRDVQPGESLYFYLGARPAIVTICRVPSVPSDDSRRCT